MVGNLFAIAINMGVIKFRHKTLSYRNPLSLAVHQGVPWASPLLTDVFKIIASTKIAHEALKKEACKPWITW